MSVIRTNHTRMYVDTMHVSLEYTSVFVDTTYDTSRPSRPSPSWNAQYSSSRPLRKRRRPWGTCSALNLPAWRGSSTLVHFGAVVADAPSPLSTPRSAAGQAQLRLGKPLRKKCRASPDAFRHSGRVVAGAGGTSAPAAASATIGRGLPRGQICPGERTESARCR